MQPDPGSYTWGVVQSAMAFTALAGPEPRTFVATEEGLTGIILLAALAGAAAGSALTILFRGER